MRQEVTRMHKGWALDSVTLHNDMLKSFKEDVVTPPNVSVISQVCLQCFILILCSMWSEGILFRAPTMMNVVRIDADRTLAIVSASPTHITM